MTYATTATNWPAAANGSVRKVQPTIAEAVPTPDIPVFDPARARLNLDELNNPPQPPQFIVDGLLPPAGGVCNGPGGAGKTSFRISEAINIALKRPLYGREVLRPGATLFITQEDSRDKFIYRASRIADELHLTPGERERVAQSIYVEDLENRRTRFVECDERGNLYPTDAADQLIDQYSGRGLSSIVVDPMIFFGAGERHMNDGAAELMLVARRVSSELGCSFEYIHHCSIQASRDKPDDQYAGRSAAAIADNARFVRNLFPYAMADGDKFGAPLPGSITPQDVADRHVLVLKAPKISDAAPINEPIWILRMGWTFQYVENDHRSRQEVDTDYARQLCDFVTSDESRDCWHTARSLEDAHGSVGIPRNQLRRVVSICEQRGWLVSQEIPTGDPRRHGKRTHRLTVGVRP